MMRADAPVIRLVPASIVQEVNSDNLPEGVLNVNQSVQPEVAELEKATAKIEMGDIKRPLDEQVQTTILGAGKKVKKSPSKNKKKQKQTSKKRKSPSAAKKKKKTGSPSKSKSKSSAKTKSKKKAAPSKKK